MTGFLSLPPDAVASTRRDEALRDLLMQCFVTP